MLDDRRDWIEHGHNTDFTGQEWDFYTYSQFAIDDGYEWHNWCVAKYPTLSNRELQGKIASFEKQQQAIYELFEVSEDGEAGETLTEARFYRKFEGKLTGMECCDVWDKLTYNEKRDAVCPAVEPAMRALHAWWWTDRTLVRLSSVRVLPDQEADLRCDSRGVAEEGRVRRGAGVHGRVRAR